MEHVWIFLITLLVPVIIVRSVLHRIANPPQETVTIQGVRFHHLHFGIITVVVAAVILIFSGANIFSVGFLGIGLGLILDEFIPSLLIPHQEPLSTKLYLSSLRGTTILFAAITVVLLALFLIFR